MIDCSAAAMIRYSCLEEEAYRFDISVLKRRRIGMTANDLRLGAFGDERLAKRGACCSREWWHGKASAFAVWPEGDGEGLLGFRAFLRTPG
jgi:hypothetical protein